ncbi:pyrimidine reductase family protein [Saccharomonospora piscinae]|uniref:pyrimidine reductase family protein n=1 Tax=Saccharomonospora piscinae TaxID=687388 RepID=UPI001106E751|nr:pyrimidine reductase family protein [Saccharomonospora piscinae]TLW95138.1 pyrimidine reductase family protein [Saccharomonospora piscinae]
MAVVDRLLPDPAGPLTDARLERLYDYPAGLTRPFVQVNFVSSADGAVSVAERSEGLSHPADKRVFALGRDLADVVLVGAGTARAEGYRGVRAREVRTERRRRLGLSPLPPIAVVTGRCGVTPDDPFVADTAVPPLVITTREAPQQRKAALTGAGVDVIEAGTHTVDPATALAALADRELLRVDCEGGPQLFGALAAADLVDQLCLTVAPLLAGAGAGRVVAGAPSPAPRSLRLASVLHEDGFLLLRYRRAGESPG